jgi:16S rRNA (guanine527-N7)-methyltransferase
MVINNQIDKFCSYYQVSRETIDALKLYEKILIKDNKNLNLIGKSTIIDIWNRHFLDSYQVIDLIEKKDNQIADLGSGAGFPGIVIGIAAKEKKFPIKIKLIEKSIKKSNFLKKIIKELNINAEVLNEDVLQKDLEFHEDVFVARAFKPLMLILELIHKKAKNWKKILIFQGKTGPEELLRASKIWDMKYKQRASITSSDSLILEIEELKKKIE